MDKIIYIDSQGNYYDKNDIPQYNVGSRYMKSKKTKDNNLELCDDSKCINLNTSELLKDSGGLQIIDKPNQYIEINGMRYTYDLFQAFANGGLDLNQPFKIVKREDGIITIEEIKCECKIKSIKKAEPKIVVDNIIRGDV